MYDLQLIEYIKIFVAGPSCCGKTFFVVDFIQNIQRICKEPQTDIVYVFKVWQPKYDEISGLVTTFIKEQEDLVEKIKSHCSNYQL